MVDDPYNEEIETEENYNDEPFKIKKDLLIIKNNNVSESANYKAEILKANSEIATVGGTTDVTLYKPQIGCTSNETPNGVIDTFTFKNRASANITVIVANSESIYNNDKRLLNGFDYTIIYGTGVVTFLGGHLPQVSDILQMDCFTEETQNDALSGTFTVSYPNFNDLG